MLINKEKQRRATAKQGMTELIEVIRGQPAENDLTAAAAKFELIDRETLERLVSTQMDLIPYKDFPYRKNGLRMASRMRLLIMVQKTLNYVYLNHGPEKLIGLIELVIRTGLKNENGTQFHSKPKKTFNRHF